MILTLGFTSGSLIGSSLIGLAFSVALVPISLAILVCGSIGLLVGQTTLKVMRVANSVLSSQKVKDDSKL